MCGISGFLNKNLPDNKQQILVEGLSELHAPRGPDFAGNWINSNAIFFTKDCL